MTGAPSEEAYGPGARRPSILLLGLLTAIDAIAIDSYVPALPAIGRSFGADAAAVQATLAAFFAGVAIGQAFWGPISDRWGRRGPLLLGMLLYVAGSLAAAGAPGLEALVAARFVQAVGASAGLVLARAIVSDIWPPEEAPRLFSIMMQILGVTALAAPLLGGALLAAGSWRAIFGLLAVIGLCCLAWTAVAVRESLPPGRSAVQSGGSFGGLCRRLAQISGFVRAVLVSAFSMGAMFAAIAGGSFLFIDAFGWSSGSYALLYAATSAAFVAACQANNMLLRRVGAARLLVAGLHAQALFALMLLALVLLGVADSFVFALFLILFIGNLGFILGNAVAEAMRLAPEDIAGTASAAIGVTQFLLSAIVAPLAVGLRDIPLSFALATAACALVAWAAATRPRVWSRHATNDIMPDIQERE